MSTNGKINSSEILEFFNILGDVSSTLDLDFLIQKIENISARLLNAESARIMLLDETQKVLYFQFTPQHKTTTFRRLPIKVGQGIGGWVVKEQKTLIVNDVSSDERFLDIVDKVTGFNTRQVIAVPLTYKKSNLGVLEVINKHGEDIFSKNDEDVIEKFSMVAASLIYSSQTIANQKNFFSHMLEFMSTSIETVRPEYESHPENTAFLACSIAKKMSVTDPDYRFLYYAGLLHDIGLIGLKSKKLTREMGFVTGTSFGEMKVAMSLKMLEGITVFEGAVDIIRHYKENFDGTGFPDKLKGDQIPLVCRILRLASSMEDLRMSSGLKGAELKENAIRQASIASGSRFDPEIVKVFIGLINESEHFWLL